MGFRGLAALHLLIFHSFHNTTNFFFREMWAFEFEFSRENYLSLDFHCVVSTVYSLLTSVAKGWELGNWEGRIFYLIGMTQIVPGYQLTYGFHTIRYLGAKWPMTQPQRKRSKDKDWFHFGLFCLDPFIFWQIVPATGEGFIFASFWLQNHYWFTISVRIRDDQGQAHLLYWFG